MINKDAVVYSVNSHIEQYVNGTHHVFETTDYTAYKITFDMSNKNSKRFKITFALIKRERGQPTLMQMSYRNLNSDIMLTLIKEHQHLGNWNGDVFIISNDIKHNKIYE